MSINQAYDRLYSDKVSKFLFLGRFPTLLDPYWQRLLNFSESTFRSREGFFSQSKHGSAHELNL